MDYGFRPTIYVKLLPASGTQGGILLSPQLAASTLDHSFVVSRLDYCSAIHEGLPTCRLKFLGRVLRTATRLVGRPSRFYLEDTLYKTAVVIE